MTDPTKTATHRTGCIQSPKTRVFLCDGAQPDRRGGHYAGLDNAYLDSVSNGIYPCKACLSVAMTAMGAMQ
jgi:hypothetical protein